MLNFVDYEKMFLNKVCCMASIIDPVKMILASLFPLSYGYGWECVGRWKLTGLPICWLSPSFSEIFLVVVITIFNGTYNNALFVFSIPSTDGG